MQVLNYKISNFNRFDHNRSEKYNKTLWRSYRKTLWRSYRKATEIRTKIQIYSI